MGLNLISIQLQAPRRCLHERHDKIIKHQQDILDFGKDFFLETVFILLALLNIYLLF